MCMSVDIMTNEHGTHEGGPYNVEAIRRMMKLSHK